jgi:hypothetical protein
MKTENCQAFWHNKKGAGCVATFPSSELPEFVMKRWRQRQECDVYYYVQDQGIPLDEHGYRVSEYRAGKVWKLDDGSDRWNYYFDEPRTQNPVLKHEKRK